MTGSTRIKVRTTAGTTAKRSYGLDDSQKVEDQHMMCASETNCVSAITFAVDDLVREFCRKIPPYKLIRVRGEF